MMWSGGLVSEEGLWYCCCDINLTSSILDGSMEGSQVLFCATVTRFLQGAAFWLVGKPHLKQVFFSLTQSMICLIVNCLNSEQLCIVTLGTVGI